MLKEMRGGLYMWGLLRHSLKKGCLTQKGKGTDLGKTAGFANPEERAGSTGLLPSAFCGSLQVRHLDCGSCNGCDWEMAAMLNPVYDLQRLGVDFVASPRHADVLMCTGPVSAHLVAAALATYEAMPAPKIVVAVGDCAIDGGVFRGGYAARQGIRDILPVTVEIPGCPPEPDDIIGALMRALGREGVVPRQCSTTTKIM